MTKYRVTTNMLSVGHGPNTYPVKNGVVELPPAETWYQALVERGTLVPMAEGLSDELAGLEELDAALVARLREAGYTTIVQLAAASDSELRAIKGVGRASLTRLRDWLDGLHNA